MDRIESQFKIWRDKLDEIDGARLVDPYVEFPEFDLYNKAFRFKKFGKCPKCGGDVTVQRDYRDSRTYGRCTAGDLEFSFHDLDLMVADDPDDVLLDIVRKALTEV